MSILKSIYKEDVRPILIKNKVGHKERTMMFEIIKHRNAGVDISQEEHEIDVQMLKMGINTYYLIPVHLRRNWQDQPD